MHFLTILHGLSSLIPASTCLFVMLIAFGLHWCRVFRVSLSELTGARYATQKAQEAKEATDVSDGLQEPPCSGETCATESYSFAYCTS
jgi:hypothetical protein